MKTIKIGEFEITEPIKCSSYKEVEDKCPKGFRLPELWELIKIMQTSNFFLECEKDNYIFFIAKQTEQDEIENGVYRLYRSNTGIWGALWFNYLNDFGEGCRVVYVKVKK